MFSIKTWLIVLVSFLILDGVWLGIIQRDYLTNIIAKLNPAKLPEHPLWSFIIVYVAMTLALTYFVLSDKNKSDTKVYLETILLALAIYGTFDFTMMNLVSGWTLTDALKDVSWGVSMFLITAYVVRQAKV